VTENALRSLTISSYLLGTRTYYVIQHSDCGMLAFANQQLRERLHSETGPDASHLHCHAFTDVEASVPKQLATIRNYPFLTPGIELQRFVYDVGPGKLREVQEQGARAKSLSS